jgi:peptidoglycan biosynthesis protein MviN/MurJ (putative lipid II flippase)
MVELMVLVTVLGPVITGLVAVIKNAVKLQNNYIPLVALVVGVVVGFVAQPITDLDLYLRLWAGGIAGLVSVGLYEVGVKREGESK